MTWRHAALLVSVLLLSVGKINAETDRLAPPKAQPAKRTWVDVSGKHSTEAELVEIHGESVYLQKPDGRIVVVSTGRLSEANRDYIKSLHTDYIFVGKVVGVTDADTFTMLGASNQQLRIRLEGIDGPESAQAFGFKAKHALGEKIFGKIVTVEWRETDRYGRFLGHVILNGNWINKQLIDEGFAWHYKEYNNSAVLSDAETKARTAGVGLWQDQNPTPPWAYRHPQTEPRATPVVAESTPDNSFVNSLAPTSRPSQKKPRQTSPPSTSEPVVDRNPYDEASTGRTATGIPTFTGPRGGRYHYSKNGKKVYEKKK